MKNRSLLIEIGCEEMPAQAQEPLAKALAHGFCDRIRRELQLDDIDHHCYASPRRLALQIHNLPPQQPPCEQLCLGPRLATAYDAQGNPTRAAAGFARSCGTDLSALETVETDKGSRLGYRTTLPGKETSSLVPRLLQETLDGLPITKRMRWGEGKYTFVRPVHWIVLLFGTELIEAEFFGIATNRFSRGHRFHHPDRIPITNADSYSEVLEKHYVLADPTARKQHIRKQAEKLARQLGGEVLIRPALLDEVSSLNEWPVAMHGKFPEEFLELPTEVLISALEDQQKYFPVRNKEALLPAFIFFSNIMPEQAKPVILGNERVIRPRLNDARFFYQRDRAHGLLAWNGKLDGVVYQQRLGSMQDKTQRLEKLVAQLAEWMGIDPAMPVRAATLAKCDLLSEMVGEFPSLQGVMGQYYALEQGEPEPVATAIREHYLPRFSGDMPAEGNVGQALALADRIDTLAGHFLIQQQPDGERDPFGLRRAGLGLIRILIEKSIDVDLRMLINLALHAYPKELHNAEVATPLFDFCMGRLRTWCMERGIMADSFEAVYALRPTCPLDFHHRLMAVEHFRSLPESASLASANRRIRNLLRQAATDKPATVDHKIFSETAEQRLGAKVDKLREKIQPLLADAAYTTALCKMAALRDDIDSFFDQVMVLCEDPTLRANRLALLQSISDLFLTVADISRLQST